MTGFNTLPMRFSAPRRAYLMNEATTPQQILIVDDEVDICFLLAAMLQRMGHATTYVHQLADGKQCLQRQLFDTVFLDLNLPDGIGFDLLPIIKGQAPKTNVIMISAFDGSSERRYATEQGADFFIGKPFTRSSVEQALKFTQPS